MLEDLRRTNATILMDSLWCSFVGGPWCGAGFCLSAGGRPEYKNSMSDKNTEPPVPGSVETQNLQVSECGSQGILTGRATGTYECHQELSPWHLGRSTTGEASAIRPSLQARPGVVSLPVTVPLGLSSNKKPS